MAKTCAFRRFVVALATPLLATCSASPHPSSSPRVHESITLWTVQYTSANGVTKIPMDVYLPPAPTGAGVIAIHGGGWRTGSRKEMSGFCKHLVTDGVVCFAPNYRLAPADPWPAAYEDLRAAVAYIRANAQKWGLDPSRLGSFGTSAGGNLAAMLAATGDVKATATWSGPMDLTTIIAQGCPTKCTYSVNRYAPTDQAKHDASPVFRVGPANPPMLIINSEDELIPLAQAQEMVAKLNAARVPYRLVVVPGTRHAERYFSTEWAGTVRWLTSHI